MRISAPVIPLAFLASPGLASPLEAGQQKRGADNCLRAVRGTPSIGLPFCSSLLTISAATATSYVAAPTVTVVVSTTSTSSTTLTTTTGTATVTAAVPLGKRRTDPTSLISSMCGYDQSRLTSACSAFLSGVPTSTTTVLSTTTPTLLTTASTTITETSIVSTAATTTVTPLPIITNPGFDDVADPLYDWTATNVGCTGCTFGATAAVSESPPNSFGVYIPNNLGYITLTQKPNLVAGQSYVFTFQYRVDSAASTNARIEVYIGSLDGGTVTSATSSWQTYTSPTYKAPANPGSILLALYTSLDLGAEGIYVDSFTATLV